jgi:hypothetical protein
MLKGRPPDGRRDGGATFSGKTVQIMWSRHSVRRCRAIAGFCYSSQPEENATKIDLHFIAGKRSCSACRHLSHKFLHAAA